MAICCLMKLFDSGELLAYMQRLKLLSVGIFFSCIIGAFCGILFSIGRQDEGRL